MIRLLSSRLFARLCAVLLATIAIQAAAPDAAAGAALERRHGSAFSAATYEVALAGRVETAAARLAPLPVPRPAPLPALPSPLLTALPAQPAPGAAPRWADPATGPPPPQVAVRLPEPRAPPRS